MILDSSGAPMKSPALPAGNARADVGAPPTTLTPSSAFPYDASKWSTQEMGDWFPQIRSPDAEINIFRDRMVARSRDLARNDGTANGAITRVLDNTVGANLKLSAQPDHRALHLRTGLKAFDATWADEFRRAAEAIWRSYSENHGRYNDHARQLTVAQQHRLALRHKLIDGEDLILTYWRPDRVGYGAADFATAFLVVDPDRLSNPYQMIDTKHLRGGVEIDDDGVPVAYHIRKAHQNDWYNAIESMEWERIEREDEDGFRRVIHDFEHERAGQNRGIGVFTSVLNHMRMLSRYYGVELQAATVAAIFGTYVTSPYDPSIVQDSLMGGDIQGYQAIRAEWAEKRPAMLNGVRIPTLAPGEDINQVQAAHPNTGFESFYGAMLRSVAGALGVSAEQVTQDWSKTNYSSARAALLESWKTLVRRRNEFSANTATPMYATWLAEAIELGILPMPKGAPDYLEYESSFSRCTWLGPGRGWIDPVKERQGSVLGMDAGLSSLRNECAENSGMDWEEILDQRQIEVQAFKERGLALPEWGGREISATEAATPQQQPQAT